MSIYTSGKSMEEDKETTAQTGTHNSRKIHIHDTL